MSTSAAPEPKGTNVKVAVRCRPLNAEEKRLAQPTVIACDSDKVMVSYGNPLRKSEKTFTFDKVFGAYSTQEDVFDSMVRPIVEEALDGFNCTIFAYGQTGTGKTHTMEGDLTCKENAGIVPRSVQHIFDKLGDSGMEFTIRVSFLELYNEELQDLLSTDPDKKLRLFEDVKKGVVCQNLEEVPVLNVENIFDILHKGINLRQTAETMCNKNSSRSHSIFTMKMYIKESNIDGEEVVRQGQLNLVDLAGSECVGRSGAKNDRAREAGNINQSLLTLGRVITALVDHHSHIPYRDSKLTRLLQESLGGKAKTCIIATVSPSQLAVEETLSTLDYAYRAKNIKNAPQQNQKLVKTVHLQEYSAEIESLRMQLQLTREKNGVYLDPRDFAMMESSISSLSQQVVECEGALKSRQEEVRSLRLSNDALEESIAGVTRELDETKETLAETSAELEVTRCALEATRLTLVGAEAVIAEQSATEKLLRSEAQQLQSDLTASRAEADILHAKIHVYAAKEAASMTRAERFVQELAAAKKELLASVQTVQSAGEQGSESICGGISTLLEQGRVTCAGLQTVIDEALQVLVGDADVSQQQLAVTLAALSAHLLAARDSQSTQLSDLKVALDSAHEGMREMLTTTKTSLEQQQTQVASMVGDVCENLSAATRITDESTAATQIEVELALQESEAMRAAMMQQLEEYRVAMAELETEHSANVAASVATMEKTVSQLARDLLSSHSKSMQSSSAALGFHSSSIKSCVSTYSDTHAARTLGLIEKGTAMKEELTTLFNETELSLNHASKEAEKSWSAAVRGTEDTLEAVEATQTTAHKSIAVTNASLHSTCDTNLVSVASAQDTTTAVLNSIKQVSRNMSVQAKESLVAFTEHMDSDGERAKKCATSHFSEVASVYGEQREMLGQLESSSVGYGSDVAGGKVLPAGNTPSKKIHKKLTDLPSTRDHDTIRAEATRGNPSPISSYRSDSSGSELSGSVKVWSEPPHVETREAERSPALSSGTNEEVAVFVPLKVHSPSIDSIADENMNPQLQCAPEVVDDKPHKVAKLSTRSGSRIRPPSASGGRSGVV